MEIKICCPKCEWENDGADHWHCTCGHIWNTFETTGRCPNCARIWQDTQCPSSAGGCAEWSPHIDWYRGLDEQIRQQIKEALALEVTVGS